MNFYSYLSTKAGCDPVKTVFLCAPDRFSTSEKLAKEFAETSGWIEKIEEDGALLIAPIAENGWRNEAQGSLFEIYQANKNNFTTSNVTLPGREGSVWLWETIIYAIGYEEGAVYALNEVQNNPNVYAASVIINPTETVCPLEDRPSDHWMVKTPSSDYNVTNRELPISVWVIGENCEETVKMLLERNHLNNEICLDCGTRIYKDDANHAIQICWSEQEVSLDIIYEKFLNRIIRWKNSPDGTLSERVTRKEYYEGTRYLHDEAESEGNVYPFSIYLPEGMKIEECKGLPVVFSVHGRGEPAWIFATKNGWEKLADDTKEFAVVLPDSPLNIWTMDRDSGSLPAMIEILVSKYGFDSSRIYLTGFSNGAVFTIQQGTTYPELFAGLSPWNGPYQIVRMAGSMAGSFVTNPMFKESGYEMPIWICAGDNDNKAGVEDMRIQADYFLDTNGYKEPTGEPAEYPQPGYERLNTTLYRKSDGHVYVAETVLKNMPHGAIEVQSNAVWNFLKHFRRNGKKVEYSE